MATDIIDEILANRVQNDSSGSEKGLSLEAAILLLTSGRVSDLDDKIKEAHGEIKSRQEKIAFFHEMLRAINATTHDDESIDWTGEERLLELLAEARALGVEIPENQTKFDKNARLRLIENLKMAADDLNLENEMQLQATTRLTNERYETYQMARAIMKPLHELKMSIIRKFSARG